MIFTVGPLYPKSSTKAKCNGEIEDLGLVSLPRVTVRGHARAHIHAHAHICPNGGDMCGLRRERGWGGRCGDVGLGENPEPGGAGGSARQPEPEAPGIAGRSSIPCPAPRSRAPPSALPARSPPFPFRVCVGVRRSGGRARGRAGRQRLRPQEPAPRSAAGGAACAFC